MQYRFTIQNQKETIQIIDYPLHLLITYLDFVDRHNGVVDFVELVLPSKTLTNQKEIYSFLVKDSKFKFKGNK